MAENDFALVLVASPRQVPWKALRSFFDQRRLTLASQEEVLNETGYKVGTVSPFWLKRDIPIYIDESVRKNKIISMGSGKSGTALIMTSIVIMQAMPDAETISLF